MATSSTNGVLSTDKPFRSKTGLIREDWRIKHGTPSRVKDGCICGLCRALSRSMEIAKNTPKDEVLPVPGETDIGWIVLKVQEMADDTSIPASKRARARWWYHRLVMADSAPATPTITQSGGRRRSHNARRAIASDLVWDGPHIRPLLET